MTRIDLPSSTPLARAPVYLAVHPAQATLLDDEVTGRLQEVGAEVTLLDVVVFIAAVSGPGPGPGGGRRHIGFSVTFFPLNSDFTDNT